MSDLFVSGPPPNEADAQSGAITPAFLETTPGSFKAIDDCATDEIETAILAMVVRAQALLCEARGLERVIEDRR